jgi:hypothetical protein
MNVDHNDRSTGSPDSSSLNTIVTCFISAYLPFAIPHRHVLPGTSFKTAGKNTNPGSSDLAYSL